MKICIKCLEEKEDSKFGYTKAGCKTYYNKKCVVCSSKQYTERNNIKVKSILREEFINAVITDNNRKFYTVDLSPLDIIYLKENGYHFIFK